MHGDRNSLLPMCSAARKKRLNSGTPPQRRIKFVQTADFERVACKYGGPSRKAYFRLAFLYARHRRQPCDTAIKINPPSDGRSHLEKRLLLPLKSRAEQNITNNRKAYICQRKTAPKAGPIRFISQYCLHMQKKRFCNTIKSATNNRFHV